MSGEWQPIETAPRGNDEEVITLAVQAGVAIVRNAVWVDDEEWGEPGWWTRTSCVGHQRLVWEPTHWMPLPPSPGATEAGDE